MKLVEFDTKRNNEWHFAAHFNLDSSIIYVILFTNHIFLASNLEVSKLNIKWSFLHVGYFKEMAKIVIKQHNDLNFDRRKTLRKSTITFNRYIDDV